MNSTDKKNVLTTAALVAAIFAVGAGCSTERHSSSYSYNENMVPEAGAPSAEYQTQTGALESGRDVVIPLEKEQVNVGKQEVDNGSLRVRKIVKTRTVTQPVEIREEQVTVDRIQDNNLNSGNTTLNQPFQGGEITIPLKREQPLVQTQVVPNGAVVIRRQDTSQQVNAQAQVRSEHVVAEPIGNPQNVNISGNLRAENERYENEAAGAPAVETGTSTGAGASKQPITQLNDLCTDRDTASLAGRPVALTNVRIERVINDHFIKVKADNGRVLFVRIDQPTAGLHEGEIVNLNGTVQRWESERAERDANGWGPADVQGMRDQKIILEVQSVTLVQQ